MENNFDHFSSRAFMNSHTGVGREGLALSLHFNDLEGVLKGFIHLLVQYQYMCTVHRVRTHVRKTDIEGQAGLTSMTSKAITNTPHSSMGFRECFLCFLWFNIRTTDACMTSLYTGFTMTTVQTANVLFQTIMVSDGIVGPLAPKNKQFLILKVPPYSM